MIRDEEDKLKARLCHDHFERLLVDNPCHDCPSKYEHKERVIQLAKLYEKDAAKATAAVITEIQSIRRGQESVVEKLRRLEKNIHGENGFQGLAQRMLIIETQILSSHKSAAWWMSVSAVVLATLMGGFAVIVTLLR